MTTPVWNAQENGPTTDLNAVNAAAGINQFLGTHATSQVGYGNRVVYSPESNQSYFTTDSINLSNVDFAQSFPMSGTTIGRVTIPFQTFGNGANVLVTLCPDNGSGSPNLTAPITQVMVPAAVSTATAAPEGLENATGTFQLPWNNTQWGTNFSQTIPWTSPASTVNGAPSFFGVATSGNYTIFAGGQDQTTFNSVANCFTIQYTGSGTVAPPVPQTPLPIATHNGMVAVTSDTLVYIGGVQTTTAVSNVWTASWNPQTGVIGAWSAGTALPTTLQSGASATYKDFVYVLGGQTGTTSSTTTSNVWYGSIQNSQIGSWMGMSPLPAALSYQFCSVIGNWIVVTGGQNTAGADQTATYYAAINPADGSLGPWLKGPALAQGTDTYTSQWCFGTTSSSMIITSGYAAGVSASFCQVLDVTPAGIGAQWNILASNDVGTRASSAFTDGTGNWYVMGYNTNNTVQQNLFRPTPLMSVPLYTTGLSNGTTYWIVLQAVQTTSASDYVKLVLTLGSQNYADAKMSSRNQNSWSVFFSGTAVPITVYDTTLSQPIVHVVEDVGTQSPMYQRWSTLAYNAQQLLTGAIEVTMEPNLALNQNPTFTTGVSPWTATNGTLTQSNAQTHGGFSFSGLLTPTGGFTSAFAQSELIPIDQYVYYTTGLWLTPTGYFYTPTTWANFSLSLNWYDSGQNPISTSSATTSLTGATWTPVTNSFQAPQRAAYFSINPTMSGSPSSSNTLFMSNAFATLAPEHVPALTSIGTVQYPTTGAPWPPTGVTQLN